MVIEIIGYQQRSAANTHADTGPRGDSLMTSWLSQAFHVLRITIITQIANVTTVFGCILEIYEVDVHII